MPRPHVATAVSAALAVAVGGCGDPAGSGPERAGSAVQAFLDACARQDTAAVLAILTPAQRHAFADAGSALDGCAQTAGLRLRDRGEVRRAVEGATLASILVEGDEGTATLAIPDEPAGHLDLQEHGLQWRIHGAPEGA
ncbi:MAG TPA: hypothetical protein VFR97_09235 [Capillimicrobium sp.]|nr:hypothetical protein [Capillimicrobium sp.]